MPLDEFRKEFRLGATQRVVLVDEAGRYAGLILLPEIYAAPREESSEPQSLLAFARYQNDVLLPTMNAKQAAAIFDKTEAEALAVVSNQSERKVIGQLSESHLLRRYAEELDRRRREVSGEI